MRRLCILIVLVSLVSACGQKGALYLPDRGAAPVTQSPPQASPDDAPDRSNEPRKRIH